MSELTIKGTIKMIGKTQEFDSGFKKRQFVITTPGDYEQDIALEFFRDKCDVLNKYKVGDSVDVWFNVTGNEYNGKYYVNLNAWRIAMTSGTTFEGIKQENPNQLNGEMAEDFNENQQSIVNDESDELPF
jgi:hypothetical protein